MIVLLRDLLVGLLIGVILAGWVALGALRGSIVPVPTPVEGQETTTTTAKFIG